MLFHRPYVQTPSSFPEPKLIFDLPLTKTKPVEYVSRNSLLQATSYNTSFVWDSTEGAFKFNCGGLGTNYAPYVNTTNTSAYFDEIVNTAGIHSDYTVSFEIKSKTINNNKWYVLLRPNASFSNGSKLCAAVSIKPSDEYGVRNLLVADTWYRYIMYCTFNGSQYFDQEIFSINLQDNSMRHSFTHGWTVSTNLESTNDNSKIYLIGANNTSENFGTGAYVPYIRNVKIYLGDARNLLLN